MKSRPSSVAPFLRSDVQAMLLARLLLDVGVEVTVGDLARASGSSVSTALAEVNRLERGGIVASRKVGTARVVAADRTYPLLQPLREIVVTLFGPPALVTDALAGVDGIERVLIHGSWARRLDGEDGAVPRDVDVIVVGTPSRREVYAAVAVVEESIRLPVNATIVTADDWESDDPFITHVRSRPLLETGHV